MNESKKVLVVSSAYDTASLLHDLFYKSRYQTTNVNSVALAKRTMMNENFDLVLIFAPVQDEFGIRSAAQIQAQHDIPVLLFVKGDHYDQACYNLQEQMVFVLAIPINKGLAAQTISVIEKYQGRIEKLQAALKKEKQRVKDEKMISRCKLMLVQHYHWSEDKAHHYIEKVAMDHSWTRAKVATILMEKISQQMGDV